MSLSHYLASITVKQFGAARRGSEPLVSCEDLDGLTEAMEKLVEHDILAMPVYSHATHEYMGLIGMLEIVKYIADLHWTYIESPAPYRKAEMHVALAAARVESVYTHRHVKIASSASYLTVLQTFLQARASSSTTTTATTGGGGGPLRRLAVSDGSGGAGSVTHLVTLSELVDCVAEGRGVLAAALARPVSSLAVIKAVAAAAAAGDGGLDSMFETSGSGRTDSKHDLVETTSGPLAVVSVPRVLTVSTSAKAIEAFRLMVSTGASAIPVVDFECRVQGVMSVHGIQRVMQSAEGVGVLYDEDCLTFGKRDWGVRVVGIQSARASAVSRRASVAADGSGDASKPRLSRWASVADQAHAAEPEGCPPVFVGLADSLDTVLERMHENRMHHVWVVDGKRRPIGCVSLMDLLHDLLNNSNTATASAV
ncbi:hypothetical protein BC831DRAFT_475895 [Entophlyctis helioformis]|nr:hypothetical protein BC831DRAFT_475895 [Entophlyctis helioformis]